MTSSLDNLCIKIVKQIGNGEPETIELFVKSGAEGVNAEIKNPQSSANKTAASQRDMFVSPVRTFAVPKTPPPTLKGKSQTSGGLTPNQLMNISQMVSDNSAKSGRSSRSASRSATPMNQSGSSFTASTPRANAKRNSTHRADLPSKIRKTNESEANSTQSYETAKSRRSVSAPPRRSRSNPQTPVEVPRHAQTQTPNVSNAFSKSKVSAPEAVGSLLTNDTSSQSKANLSASDKQPAAPNTTLNLSKPNGVQSSTPNNSPAILNMSPPAANSSGNNASGGNAELPNIIAGYEGSSTPPGYFSHQKKIVLNTLVNGVPLKTNLTLYVSTRNPKANMQIAEFWADDQCLYRKDSPKN